MLLYLEGTPYTLATSIYHGPRNIVLGRSGSQFEISQIAFLDEEKLIDVVFFMWNLKFLSLLVVWDAGCLSDSPVTYVSSDALLCIPGNCQEALKEEGEKRVRKFSLWAVGENKNIFVLWRFLRKGGLASKWLYLSKGNFHIWENMVVINDLREPRKWTLLEKYLLQWPSHCQLMGPENGIVLEWNLYLWMVACKSFPSVSLVSTPVLAVGFRAG